MLAPSVIYCLTQRSRIIYPVYRVAFPASFSSRSWSTRRFIPRPSQDAMIHIRASFLRHARHAGRNARRGFNLSLLHVLRNCATSSINCCSPFLYPLSPSLPLAALAYTHAHASWSRELATSHARYTIERGSTRDWAKI